MAHRLLSLVLVIVLLANQVLSVTTAVAAPSIPAATPAALLATADSNTDGGDVPQTVPDVPTATVGRLLIAPALDTDGDPVSNPTADIPVPIIRFGTETGGLAIIGAQLASTNTAATTMRVPVTVRVWNDKGVVYEESLSSDEWGAVQAEVRLDSPIGEYRYQVSAPGYGTSETRSFHFDPSHAGLALNGIGATLVHQQTANGTHVFTLTSQVPLEAERDIPVLLLARRPQTSGTTESDSVLQPVLAEIEDAELRLPLPDVPMQIVDDYTAQVTLSLPQGDYRFVGSLTINQSDISHYFSNPIDETFTANTPISPSATAIWIANLEHDPGKTLVQYEAQMGEAIFALVANDQLPILDSTMPPHRDIVQQWRTGPFEWQEQSYTLDMEAATATNAVSVEDFTYDPIDPHYSLALRSTRAGSHPTTVRVEVLGPNDTILQEQESDLILSADNATAYTVAVPASLGRSYGVRLSLGAIPGTYNDATVFVARWTGDRQITGPLATSTGFDEEDAKLPIITELQYAGVQIKNFVAEYVNARRGISISLYAKLEFFLKILSAEIVTYSYTYDPPVLGKGEYSARSWSQIIEDVLLNLSFDWWTERSFVLASGGASILYDMGLQYTFVPGTCPNARWQNTLEQRIDSFADRLNVVFGDFASKDTTKTTKVKTIPLPVGAFLQVWAKGTFATKLGADSEGLTLKVGAHVELTGSVDVGWTLNFLDFLDDAAAFKKAYHFFVAVGEGGALYAVLVKTQETNACGTGTHNNNGQPNTPGPGSPDDRQDVWQTMGALYEGATYEETTGNLNMLLARAHAQGLTRAERVLTLRLRETEIEHFTADPTPFYDYWDTSDAIGIDNLETLQGIISGTIPISSTQTITEALIFQNEQAVAEIAALPYATQLWQLSDNLAVAEQQYQALYGQELEVQAELRILFFENTVGVAASGFADTTLSALKEAGLPGQLISLWSGRETYMGLPAPYVAPDLAPRVLVMPSGGMHAISNSPEARAWLETYVRGGGTMIVFTQAFGSDWNALPGGEIYGVGYEEDQRCEQESVRAVNPSPWLVWMGVETPDIQVDGAFTGWPANATPLLVRRSGLYQGYPAMIEYPLGAGHVLATSAYGDWATKTGIRWGDDWEMTRTILIRAMLLSRGQDIGDVLTTTSNSDVTVTFPVTNTSASPSTRVTVELPLFTNHLPNYHGNIDSIPMALAPGAGTVVNAHFHTPPVMRGVHNWTQVGLFNVDAAVSTEDYGSFIFWPRFLYIQSPIQPVDVGVTLTASPVTARPGQTVTVTATVHNFTSEDKTVTLKGINEVPATPITFTIPAGGSATQPYSLLMDKSRFPRVAVYEGVTERNRASLAVYMSEPNLQVTPTLPSMIENSAVVGVVVQNSSTPWRPASTSLAGEVRLSLRAPNGTEVWNGTQPLPTLPAGASVPLSFTLGTLPPATTGTYTLHYQVFDNGELHSEGDWRIASKLQIKGVFNDTSYRVREPLLFTATLINTGDFTLDSQVTVSIPDSGAIITTTLALPADGISTIPFSTTLPSTLTAGNHDVLVQSATAGATATARFGFSIAPGNVVADPPSGLTYQAGETLSLTLRNTGGADITASYTITLGDDHGVIVAETSATATVLTNETVAVPFVIPAGAKSGEYQLLLDGQTAPTQRFGLHRALTISGSAASLNVHPDQPEYTAGDNVAVEGVVESTTGTINGTLRMDIRRMGSDTFLVGDSIRINSNREIGMIAHGSSSVAFDGSGNAYALWTDDRTVKGTQRLFFDMRQAGGRWGASVAVDSTGAFSQTLPALTVDAAGNAYAVWTDYRASATNPDIYYAYRPTGGIWSTSERVNSDTTTTIQTSAAIALDSAGTAYVVWTDYRAGTNNPNIYFADRVAGGGWSANELVNTDGGTTAQTEPALAITTDGTVHVVWQDNRGNNGGDIYYAARASNGTWSANARLNATSFRRLTPALAADSTGTLYAVWPEFTNGGAVRGLYTSRRPLGGTWSTSVQISNNAAAAPAIAIDTANNVHALWMLIGVTVPHLYYSTRPAATGVWSTRLQIDDAIKGERSAVAVAAAPNGVLLAAWLDKRNTPNGHVYSDERSTSGTWGTDLPLSDALSGTADQIDPDLAMGPTGTLYTVWQDKRNNSDDIYFAARPIEGTWTDDQAVTTNSSSVVHNIEPAIAVDGNDTPYAVWSFTTSSGIERLGFAYRTPAGVWTNAGPLPYPDNISDQSNPGLAVDIAGNAYAVWEQAPPFYGDGPYVFFSYRPAGGTWTTSVSVSTGGRATRSNPTVAVDASSNAYAVWQDWRDSDGPAVYFSYRPAGGTWSTNQRVSPGPLPVYTAPSLAVDAAGNAYVAWGENRSDHYTYLVATRPAGGTWGTPEIAATTVTPKGSPVLAVNHHGALAMGFGTADGLFVTARQPGNGWLTPTRVDNAPGTSLYNSGAFGITLDDDDNAHIGWQVLTTTGTVNRDLYSATVKLPGVAETVWQQSVPVSTTTTQSISETAGTLDGEPGKYWLDVTLQTPLSQTLATTGTPFYIFAADTALTLETDKTVYRTDDTITVSGALTNTRSTTATLTLKVLAGSQTILETPYTLASGEGVTYSVTTPAVSDVLFTATAGTAQVAQPVAVATPSAIASLSVPEVVGSAPFSATVTLTNTGVLTVALAVTIANGEPVAVTVAPGAVQTVAQSVTVSEATTINATVRGDRNFDLAKPVAWGEGGSAAWSPSSATTAGLIPVTYTITGTGTLPTAAVVSYWVDDGAATHENVTLYAGQIISQTLLLDIDAGTHTLSLTLENSAGRLLADDHLVVNLIPDEPLASPDIEILSIGVTAPEGFQSSDVNLMPAGEAVTVTVNIANNGNTAPIIAGLQLVEATEQIVITPTAYATDTFTFALLLPNDLPSGTYWGQVIVDDQTQPFSITVGGIDVALDLSLGATSYRVGDEVHLTATLTEEGGRDGEYPLSFRYGNDEEVVTMTLAAGDVVAHTFIFTATESDRASVSLAYSGDGPSELVIMIDSLPVQVVDPSPGAYLTFDKSEYNAGETINLSLIVTGSLESLWVAGPLESALQADEFLLWVPPVPDEELAVGDIVTGTYPLTYTLPTSLITGQYTFDVYINGTIYPYTIDVNGWSVTPGHMTFDDARYEPGDVITATTEFFNEGTSPIEDLQLTAWVFQPDGTMVDFVPSVQRTVTLAPGLNEFVITGTLQTDMAGSHRLLVNVGPPNEGWRVAGAAAQFDVGAAHLVALGTDHGIYTPGDTGTGRLDVYGYGHTHLLVTASDGSTVLDSTVTLSGFYSTTFTIPTAIEGDYLLTATSSDVNGTEDELQQPYAVPAPLDTEAPVITLTTPSTDTIVTSDVPTMTYTVSGSVSDNVGVTRVLVNGAVVTPTIGGDFTATVILERGLNGISVTALDAPGNIAYSPIISVYLLPEYAAVLEVDRPTVTAGELITFMLTLTSSAELDDISWQLPFATEMVTDVTVIADSGVAAINTLVPNQTVATWEGDVVDTVQVTVTARLTTPGILTAKDITFWGWGLRDLHTYYIHVHTNEPNHFTVTTPTDNPDTNLLDGLCRDAAGRCTLRAAIEQANAMAGVQTVEFDLDLNGSVTVSLETPLPAITDRIIVDGTTQLTYNNDPIVEINGDHLIQDGLVIYAGGSVVRGLSAAGFVRAGYVVSYTENVTLERNRMAENGMAGVLVQESTGVHLSQNRMFDNEGTAIDLGGNGRTINDAGDSDEGANRLQNYPEIPFAGLSAGNLVITYRVDSAPANTTYPLTVEFFKADMIPSTQGQDFLGSATYTGPGVATATIFNAEEFGIVLGDRIVATATDANGNTSEFSNAGLVSVPTGVVLNGFDAMPISNGIRVVWETASETDILGFNLWRGTTPDAPTEQLNTELLPSQAPGNGQGAEYEWDDTVVTPGTTYYYWLESVSITGHTERYGPVSATAQMPTAIALDSFAALPVLPWEAIRAALGLFLILLGFGVIVYDRRSRFPSRK